MPGSCEIHPAPGRPAARSMFGQISRNLMAPAKRSATPERPQARPALSGLPYSTICLHAVLKLSAAPVSLLVTLEAISVLIGLHYEY